MRTFPERVFSHCEDYEWCVEELNRINLRLGIGPEPDNSSNTREEVKSAIKESHAIVARMKLLAAKS